MQQLSAAAVPGCMLHVPIIVQPVTSAVVCISYFNSPLQPQPVLTKHLTKDVMSPPSPFLVFRKTQIASSKKGDMLKHLNYLHISFLGVT